MRCLLRHLALEAAALLGRRRSARRRRWRARRRRHKARSARRRADRAAGRASAACPTGYSSRMVARPMPRLASIFSTSTRLKMSAQRRRRRRECRQPARRGRMRRGRLAVRLAGNVARRSMPAKRSNASATVSRSGSANGSAARPRKVRLLRPGGVAACARIAAQSSISASYGSPARYHSSSVNSGWCSAPRSRLRNTWANSKMRRSPAASSFLQANSGEVCR